MKIARVAGTVVATVRHPALDGKRLLRCDLLDASLAPTGRYVIAVDPGLAGAGEVVLILDEGNGARQILADPHAPIRAIVAGVIDAIALDDAGG